MPADPSLSDVHADLVGRLEQDKRLRALEVSHARQVEAVKNLEEYLPRMEDRLTNEVRAAKPNWLGILSATAGICMAAMALFAVIYSH